MKNNKKEKSEPKLINRIKINKKGKALKKIPIGRDKEEILSNQEFKYRVSNIKKEFKSISDYLDSLYKIKAKKTSKDSIGYVTCTCKDCIQHKSGKSYL